MIFKVIVPISKPFKDSKGSSEHFVEATSKESALSKVLVRLLQEKDLSYTEPGRGPRKFGANKIGLLFHIISQHGDFKASVSSEPLKVEKKEDKDDWKAKGVKMLKNKNVKENIQTSLFAMDKVAGLLQGRGLLKYAEQVDQVSNTIDSIMAPVQSTFSLNDLVREMIKDLEFEFAAAVQYIQHSSVITGAEYDTIRNEILIHAKQEIDHGCKISEKINYLGGTPGVIVEKRYVSGDVDTMLRQDLDGEKTAIARYKVRIKQAESLGEHGVKAMYEEILQDEENHENDLLTSLGLKRS